jgi:hypothetical protein
MFMLIRSPSADKCRPTVTSKPFDNASLTHASPLSSDGDDADADDGDGDDDGSIGGC